MSIIPQLIINSIIAGAIYALLALGFNLIFGATKFFNFAYGVVAAVGGYVAFYFYKTLGLNIFLAVLLGIIVAGLISLVINKLVYERIRTKKGSNMVLLVASLGVFTFIQAILAIIFTGQFQTIFKDNHVEKIFQIATGIITQTQIIIIAASLATMLGLGMLLKYTRFGQAIKAISDDEEVAKIVGIDTTKIISYVFWLGGAIAGLAGILVGLDTGIDPNIGLGLLLKGVIVCIIGGAGSFYGGILGGFLLGFVENFGIWKISGEWKDAIAFALLILFLLFRPQGIMKK